MKKLLTAAILATLASGAAHAGLYVGADVGYATGYKHLTEINKQSGQMVNGHVGYRIGELVAAEVGYGKLLGVKAGNDKIDASLIHASGLVFLPIPTLLTFMLDIYGRVGVATTDGKVASLASKNTTLLYGAGVEFNYLPLVGFRAEAKYMPDFVHKGNAVTTFSAGVNIKF